MPLSFTRLQAKVMILIFLTHCARPAPACNPCLCAIYQKILIKPSCRLLTNIWKDRPIVCNWLVYCYIKLHLLCCTSL